MRLKCRCGKIFGWAGTAGRPPVRCYGCRRKRARRQYIARAKVWREKNARPTDNKRMDFMEACITGKTMFSSIRAESMRDWGPWGKDKKWATVISFFSVQSQHVTGIGLRGAIDAAMKKVRESGKKWEDLP